MAVRISTGMVKSGLLGAAKGLPSMTRSKARGNGFLNTKTGAILSVM